MKIKYHTSVSVILMVALTYVVTFLWFKKDGVDIVRLDDVFFSVALSFIAASIFYYTVDYFPKKARKKAFLENLEFRVLHIERLYTIILKNLNYTGDHLTIQNVSKKELSTALRNTHLNQITKENTIVKEHITLKELFQSRRTDILQELDELEKHIDLFSPELYDAMTSLKRSNIFMLMGSYRKIYKNKTKSKIVPSLLPVLQYFYDDICSVRQLRETWDANRK